VIICRSWVPLATVVSQDRHTCRGSLRGTLVLTDDWDNVPMERYYLTSYRPDFTSEMRSRR
jgi:hypothetical protein